MKPKTNPLHFALDFVRRVARETHARRAKPKGAHLEALYGAVRDYFVDEGMTEAQADTKARKFVFEHGPSMTRYQITEAIHRAPKRVADEQ
ncbi:hypothetical protein [Acuticoccus yangtzensis]|uniref:hypothetical protein n=1 Tax=Acuticoccus yangtzensis TaxID=1443441 RepID=UPI0009498D73|nr:hypothetical protein [Acuticoccus yangtzensis]